jgi:hypothetical protein
MSSGIQWYFTGKNPETQDWVGIGYAWESNAETKRYPYIQIVGDKGQAITDRSERDR